MLHHGHQRRGGDVRRVRVTHQPPGPPAARSGPGPPRPLLDLHGEQPPLPRDVRGRRALGAVLHGDQLAPHAPTSWRTSSTTASRGCSSRRARSSTSSARSWRCARPSSAGWSSTGRNDEAPFEDYLDRRLRLPRHADRRRAPGRGDALLVGDDRAAEGDHPPARRRLAIRGAGPDAVPHRPVALPGRPDLPVAGAAVPLGAAGRGRPHDPQRRHGDHHGALRPRGVPAARRALRGHPQPARADDVQPDAEAARRRPLASTTCRRWRPSSTPPHRARSRSRRR